jgi:hypothetical protein
VALAGYSGELLPNYTALLSHKIVILKQVCLPENYMRAELISKFSVVSKCSGIVIAFAGVAVCREGAKQRMQMHDFPFLLELKHGFITILRSSLRLFLDLAS